MKCGVVEEEEGMSAVIQIWERVINSAERESEQGNRTGYNKWG